LIICEFCRELKALYKNHEKVEKKVGGGGYVGGKLVQKSEKLPYHGQNILKKVKKIFFS
jgi:hypothetical protein